jgi:hypothetical protein
MGRMRYQEYAMHLMAAFLKIAQVLDEFFYRRIEEVVRGVEF